MIWLLLGALAIAAVVYLGVVLGVGILRRLRTRRNTKLLVADMNAFIRNMSDKEKHSVSFSDLARHGNKQFVSEFDPETENVIKTTICDKGFDEQMQSAVNSCRGYIIVGD